MIKFKTKINLKYIKYRLDICEQNIETLNNILNLKICLDIHKHGLDTYVSSSLTDVQRNTNCQINKLRKISS